MLKDNFNPINTNILSGHKKKFIFFKELIRKNKFPKVIMLSGEKGIGKFTLVNHLMHYLFDRENYKENSYEFSLKSVFHNQFKNNLISNIKYLNANDFNNVKIDDVRKLKNDLLKKNLNQYKRFVILDDVETFNINTLNALLKIIEEPSEQTYFFLINNKKKELLQTIKSRCLEIKVILNKSDQSEIFSFITKYFKQNSFLDNNLVKTSPGNLLKYNYLIEKNNINPNDNFIQNIKIFLDLYKKEKNLFYKDTLLFFSEYYLLKNNIKTNFIGKYLEDRSFIIKNINDFFLYNLNQDTLIRSIENNIFYE